MDKKEKLSVDDAKALLNDWADALDINADTDDFREAVDTLLPAVRSERLVYDADSEVFHYRLSAPLVLATATREMVDIKELTIDEKRSIERFKDTEKISMVEAIYAKAAGLSIAEASRIKGRDFSVITAVNQVFFS